MENYLDPDTVIKLVLLMFVVPAAASAWGTIVATERISAPLRDLVERISGRGYLTYLINCERCLAIQFSVAAFLAAMFVVGAIPLPIDIPDNHRTGDAALALWNGLLLLVSIRTTIWCLEK